MVAFSSCLDWIGGGFLCRGNSGLMGKDELGVASCIESTGPSRIFVVLLVCAYLSSKFSSWVSMHHMEIDIKHIGIIKAVTLLPLHSRKRV